MHLTPQRHTNAHRRVERGGQITSGVFQHLQSKQAFSLSQILYLLHAREERKESIFLESDHSLPLQPRKENRHGFSSVNSIVCKS